MARPTSMGDWFRVVRPALGLPRKMVVWAGSVSAWVWGEAAGVVRCGGTGLVGKAWRGVVACRGPTRQQTRTNGRWQAPTRS